ncbi:MAG TPA: hypothetical protein VJ021_00190 [Thermoplasmata archaeon]|nr:hypothetical protein [Thermoplasmata archaeon]
MKRRDFEEQQVRGLATDLRLRRPSLSVEDSEAIVRRTFEEALNDGSVTVARLLREPEAIRHEVKRRLLH